MSLAPGTSVGPFEIVALIGAGGMGEVYRAHDPRLQRDVAIKRLRTDDDGDPDQLLRFEQEARLLASLNDPHIATIHGVERVGDAPALIMEYVDGPSLAELIARGPLTLERTARLAGQIADGLSAAHARGIVHRDLKPANILVTSDDRVKLLDLGIAKLITSPEAPAVAPGGVHTRTGLVIGTPGYMSPEQAVGEPVDVRTDVWAFGAVLFEMLAGERPFPGRTPQALLVSVMTGAVAWERLPEAVPGEMRNLLTHCLEPDLDRRLSDLSMVREALHASRAPLASRRAPDSAATRTVVVLPFVNLSPEPDTEFFSDGLTDELITDLSRVRALRVISRSSAARLKGDPRELHAIARDLGCRYVLEGTVRRASNNLRITARLVDAVNDVQLWADKYGGTLEDVFDMQERVSRAIVDALSIELSPREVAQMADRPINDVRAHESYLRAQAEIWSFMPGSLDRAVTHLQAALSLIGDNALILEGLGVAYFQYVNIGAAVGQEEAYLAKADACAQRIFALDPDSARGHIVRAHTHLARGEVHAAARSFRRVLAANPSEVAALQMHVHLLGWLVGKAEQWPPYTARLAEVDPLSGISHLVRAMALFFDGRFDEALEAARHMVALDPLTPVLRANLVMVLAYAGRVDEAEAVSADVVAEPTSDVGTWQIGLLRAAWRGDQREVVRLTDGPLRATAMWDAEVPWLLAVAHAKVGLRDDALFWLERAIDGGMINYPFFARHDRFLDSVRDDPRFLRALARAQRAWETFQA